MASNKVWISANWDDLAKSQVVVLGPDALHLALLDQPMFGAGKAEDALRAQLEQSSAPEQDLPDCKSLSLDRLDRVRVKDGAKVQIEYGRSSLQFDVSETEKFVEALQSCLGSGWTCTQVTENRLFSALKILAGTLFVVAFFLAFYYLIEKGAIDRAWWLIAFIANTMGTFALLILAGISLFVGLLLLVGVLRHPVRIWTFEPIDSQ